SSALALGGQQTVLSPEGTVESSAPRSPNSQSQFSRPFGTTGFDYSNPALKRRAIASRPSGTLELGSLRSPHLTFTMCICVRWRGAGCPANYNSFGCVRGDKTLRFLRVNGSVLSIVVFAHLIVRFPAAAGTVGD